MGIEHLTQPLSNVQIYGVPIVAAEHRHLQPGLPAGVSDRNQLHVRVEQQPPNHEQRFQQPGSHARDLLPSDACNSSCCRVSDSAPTFASCASPGTTRRISDIAFKDQLVATITQISDIYWDLVSAYEQERVTEQSFSFAQQSLSNAQKQLQLEAVPEMDVMRAEAEVSRRDQDLLIAKTNLQLQESLMKNAITKNLDDPVLESMPVIPDRQLRRDRRAGGPAGAGTDRRGADRPP